MGHDLKTWQSAYRRSLVFTVSFRDLCYIVMVAGLLIIYGVL